MMTDTPRFIEPDDVDGGYAPLPVFVTCTCSQYRTPFGLTVIEDTGQKPVSEKKESI